MLKFYKILIILFAITNNFCNAQTLCKRVYGSVQDIFNHNWYLFSKIPATEVKIFAQDRTCQGAAGQLLYSSNNNLFEFILEPEIIDSFTYLFFETKYGYDYIPIKYLQTEDSIFVKVPNNKKLSNLNPTVK
jgi:hypothetical protein